jgi:hypothetical protein
MGMGIGGDMTIDGIPNEHPRLRSTWYTKPDLDRGTRKHHHVGNLHTERTDPLDP